jgi:drug/metabolite transporter (DMT)-like permease
MSANNAETRPPAKLGPTVNRLRLARHLKAELYLALMCVIWGATFALVRDSVAGTDPHLYLLARFLLAVLFTVLLFGRRIAFTDLGTALRGLLLGMVLYLGFIFQTIGLVHTGAARSGFLTALYIVMVPLLLALWRRRLPGLRVFAAGLAALLGVAAFGGTDLLSGDWLGLGETLTLICALFFAVQILLAGALPVPGRVWTLHFWQLLTVTALSAIGWLWLGEPRVTVDSQLMVSLLFTGVLGTVVALGLQLRWQPETTPERAAIVYSFEPVFAALAAFLLLGERLGWVELVGAALILLGLRLAEAAPQEPLADPVALSPAQVPAAGSVPENGPEDLHSS